MSEATVEEGTTVEVAPPIDAPKEYPREPWRVCGRCYCVVAALEEHTLAVHQPVSEAPAPESGSGEEPVASATADTTEEA